MVAFKRIATYADSHRIRRFRLVELISQRARLARAGVSEVFPIDEKYEVLLYQNIPIPEQPFRVEHTFKFGRLYPGFSIP